MALRQRVNLHKNMCHVSSILCIKRLFCFRCAYTVQSSIQICSDIGLHSFYLGISVLSCLTEKLNFKTAVCYQYNNEKKCIINCIVVITYALIIIVSFRIYALYITFMSYNMYGKHTRIICFTHTEEVIKKLPTQSVYCFAVN